MCEKSIKEQISNVKDVPGGFPKSDLLGVTVALIHVAAQRPYYFGRCSNGLKLKKNDFEYAQKNP